MSVSSNVGGDSRTNPCIYIRTDEQNDLSPTTNVPVILRIFEENQNPVNMHTSIMCINILQNIKAVAPKLGQTMYLYLDGQMDGRTNERTARRTDGQG